MFASRGGLRPGVGGETLAGNVAPLASAEAVETRNPYRHYLPFGLYQRWFDSYKLRRRVPDFTSSMESRKEF